jgi:double zinc ribbon protein
MWFLIGLCVAYVVALLLMIVISDTTPNSADVSVGFSIGLLMFLAVVICMLVADWRGFLTLRGRLNWEQMAWWKRIVTVLVLMALWVFFGSMPGLYLGFALKDTFAAKRQQAFTRLLRTAQLEAELGIKPAMEGTCPSCGKPAQVGAHYCQYCSAPLVTRPRICQRCAALAQPDATYCPNCGASLDVVVRNG